MVVLDVDEKGANHCWMPMSLLVRGNSDVKWSQVAGWIKPKTQNSTPFVQNRTRSSSVQSKANTIIGKGAAFNIQTLQVHFCLHFATLPSLHTALKLSTCCLPRSKALAVRTDLIPPASYAILLQFWVKKLINTLSSYILVYNNNEHCEASMH